MPDEKRSAWFKWFVGSVIALIGAGGGLVAILNYVDARREQAETEFQQALTEWENFQPPSNGVQRVRLRGLDRFDLETGRVTSNPNASAVDWDLLFGCWPGAQESLRASDGVQWADLGVVDFEALRYREIRDAAFQSARHGVTGHPDLYYDHKSNAPGEKYTFAVKTPDDNVAKVQILGYENVSPDPEACRNVSLQYEVFPIVPDPPRPRRR